MEICIDLTIICIILLSTFIGYKKGLIKVSIKILSFFIAVIVAFVLYKPVSNFIIQNTQIDEMIEAAIFDKVGTKEVTQEKLTKDNAQNTPQLVIDYLNESITNLTNDVKDNVAIVVAKNFSILIIQVGTALALFFITKVALLFVKVLANIIEKIPIIKQFNKAGGIVYGILEGLLIVYLILGILSVISPLFLDNVFIKSINHSSIGSIMYNHNILLSIIF